MAKFRYRALTAGGEIVTGELVAPHRAEVLRHIEYMGLIPVETARLRDGGASLADLMRRDFAWKDLTRARATPDDVTAFSRDLAVLLRSGVRLDQALGLLSDPDMTGPLAPIIAAVNQAVKSGESLADALAREPTLFPHAFSTLVRIGEASGNLPNVMEALAEQRAKLSTMRRSALDALRYPAFLLAAAFAVLAFFLVYVLPKFASVFQDLGSQIDPVVKALLWLSDTVQAHGTAMMVAGAAVAILGAAALRSPAARSRAMSVVVRLPILRDLARDYRTALFCRMLGTLLVNGAQITQALSLVADVVANDSTKALWARTRDRVREGARLGEALSEHTELAPVALRMLKIGEEAGHLAEISLRAADLVEIRLERRMKRLTAMVGPAAILAIALFVGGLVVSLMTSLISIGQLAN